MNLVFRPQDNEAATKRKDAERIANELIGGKGVINKVIDGYLIRVVGDGTTVIADVMEIPISGIGMMLIKSRAPEGERVDGYYDTLKMEVRDYDRPDPEAKRFIPRPIAIVPVFEDRNGVREYAGNWRVIKLRKLLAGNAMFRYFPPDSPMKYVSILEDREAYPVAFSDNYNPYVRQRAGAGFESTYWRFYYPWTPAYPLDGSSATRMHGNQFSGDRSEYGRYIFRGNKTCRLMNFDINIPFTVPTFAYRDDGNGNVRLRMIHLSWGGEPGVQMCESSTGNMRMLDRASFNLDSPGQMDFVAEIPPPAGYISQFVYAATMRGDQFMTYGQVEETGHEGFILYTIPESGLPTGQFVPSPISYESTQPTITISVETETYQDGYTTRTRTTSRVIEAEAPSGVVIGLGAAYLDRKQEIEAARSGSLLPDIADILRFDKNESGPYDATLSLTYSYTNYYNDNFNPPILSYVDRYMNRALESSDSDTYQRLQRQYTRFSSTINEVSSSSMIWDNERRLSGIGIPYDVSIDWTSTCSFSRSGSIFVDPELDLFVYAKWSDSVTLSDTVASVNGSGISHDYEELKTTTVELVIEVGGAATVVGTLPVDLLYSVYLWPADASNDDDPTTVSPMTSVSDSGVFNAFDAKCAKDPATGAIALHIDMLPGEHDRINNGEPRHWFWLIDEFGVRDMAKVIHDSGMTTDAEGNEVPYLLEEDTPTLWAEYPTNALGSL